MQINNDDNITRLRAVYFFEPSETADNINSFDIKNYADQLPAVANYVPQYWDVDEKDREFLRSFHSNPTFYGRNLVSFGLDISEGTVETERLKNLLSEVVNHKSGKRWMLEKDVLVCKAGFSGEVESVKAQIIKTYDLRDSDQRVPKQSSAPKG